MRKNTFFTVISTVLAAAFAAAFATAFAAAATACAYDPPDPRQQPVTGIAHNKTNLALNLWTGENFDYKTANLRVNIFPEKANRAVTWGSSNNNVARVADGLVTAVAKGTAIITAIAKDGGLMAICSVVVVDQEPGPVEGVSIPDSLTLYLGGTDRQTLIPVFSPIFVTDERVTWSTGNPAVARVNQDGTVTAAGAGTASITVTTADGGFTDTCVVTVTPLAAQFGSIAAFLAAAYYKPGFDFGTDPVAKGDTASNTSTWTGTNTNHPDFVLNYTYNYDLFGKAGAKNLVPQFEPPKDSDNKYFPSGTLGSDPYRSHTQFNNAAIAHYAFTGYRQAHPWGVNSLTPAPSAGAGTTRAGQTWSVGVTAYAANTNTVQYSGIGVDLGRNTYIDTVMIYAGGNITNTSAFNSMDTNAKCPGITLEYMPDTASARAVFNALYKANVNVPTANWNNPAGNNNWPPPGLPGEPAYPGSPWKQGGKIVPNGSSWVYVFHFEQLVLARYLRCNFEQAPVAAPAAGYLGRAFVNSFEVYNTKEK